MLSKKAEKIILRFSKDRYYVYLRPVTSLFAWPSEEEKQWWVASVQIRAMPPHEFREEGVDLDAIILKLGERVPTRKELRKSQISNNHERTEHVGFLAPQAQWERKYGPSSYSFGDHRGEGRPSTATERGWGTMDTVLDPMGQAAPDRASLAKLVPPLPR